MARIFRQNLAKDYNCSKCDDTYKRMRHCPFIPKSEWKGQFFVPLKGEDGDIVLDCCPLGFLIQHRDLQIYFDCKKFIDKGLPLYSGIGMMELPNNVVEAVNLLDNEFGYIPKADKELIK